jgi:hypothetical protein
MGKRYETRFIETSQGQHRTTAPKSMKLKGELAMNTDWARSMDTIRIFSFWSITLLTIGGATGQQDDFDTDIQVLTRGPMHEAFASPSESEVAPDFIVSRRPPADITELPPDHRPEGDNVSWIPGYWAWDDDRDDYIWVSGVWRDLPPNRQWVPGYWTDVQGGSQFVSGFWADVSRNEIDYLPQPPMPLERGPSSPPIASNYNWSTGSWVWVDTRYAWQPGYWVAVQPGWVWMPAHYVWTPRGYVYVSGYWDYEIPRRGILFAPVYYISPVYQRPNYRYSPRTTINISIILGHVFVHSHSHHYYYGDFYDARYRDRGYEPWYTRHHRYGLRDGRGDRYYGEDPNYASYRSQQIQRDPDWDRHVQEQYTRRRENVSARPPRTMAEQLEAGRDARTDAARQNTVVAVPFEQVVNRQAAQQRFVRVDANQRTNVETQSREIRQYRIERSEMEATRYPAPTAGRDISGTRPLDGAPSRGRGPQQVQPDYDRTERPPVSWEDTNRDSTRPPRPTERWTPGGDATRVEPGQTNPPARPDTTGNVRPRESVRQVLRESPIASGRLSDSLNPAPPIPRPEAVRDTRDKASPRRSE